MAIINPYLNFPGNTEDAFKFYKSVFGGEFPMVMRFKDSPAAATTLAADQDKLMHVALPIGSNVLMGTDAVGPMADELVVGNNIMLSVSAKSLEEADAIFNGLSGGGKITSPMKQEFWGAYFGMLTDKFGIHWMISHDQNFA